MRFLARTAKRKDPRQRDSTRYTSSWTATSFISHHSQRTVTAAVMADALEGIRTLHTVTIAMVRTVVTAATVEAKAKAKDVGTAKVNKMTTTMSTRRRITSDHGVV